MTANIAATSGEQPARQVRALPPRPKPDSGPAMLPEVPGDGIICFDTSVTEQEKRSVLFRIRNADGELTEYTVWDNPPASLGLRMLDVMRTQGVGAAVPWALEVMLGTDALAALKACPSLTPDGLQRVAEVCFEKLNATLGPEPPKAAD